MQVIEQDLQVVGGPVESISLPSLLKNIQKADATAVVIKLDIQGFECRVLRHFEMFNTLQNIPYIFMEWNMLGSTELCPDLLDFIGMMEKQGYIARDLATVFLQCFRRFSPLKVTQIEKFSKVCCPRCS